MKQTDSNSNKLAVLVIAVVLAVAVFSIAANVIYQRTGFRGTYNKAVELAVRGEVGEAEALFQSIEDRHYNDTDSFLLYCRAVEKAENGDFFYGYENKDKMIFEKTTDEQNAIIEEQLDNIVRAYEKEKE